MAEAAVLIRGVGGEVLALAAERMAQPRFQEAMAYVMSAEPFPEAD